MHPKIYLVKTKCILYNLNSNRLLFCIGCAADVASGKELAKFAIECCHEKPILVNLKWYSH